LIDIELLKTFFEHWTVSLLLMLYLYQGRVIVKVD